MFELHEIHWLPYLVSWSHALLLETITRLRIPSLERYRLGRATTPDKVSRHAVLVTVLFQNLVAFLLSLLGTVDTTVLPLGALLPRIVAFMVVYETYTYWYHYALHRIPSLYYRIHRHHHRVINVYPFAGQYAGIIDTILGIWLPPLLAGTLTSMPTDWVARLSALYAFKANYDHLGYALPFPLDPFNLPLTVPGYNRPRYHSLHHAVETRNFNFSNGFSNVWDHLNGTFLAESSPPSEDKRVP